MRRPLARALVLALVVVCALAAAVIPPPPPPPSNGVGAPWVVSTSVVLLPRFYWQMPFVVPLSGLVSMQIDSQQPVALCLKHLLSPGDPFYNGRSPSTAWAEMCGSDFYEVFNMPTTTTTTSGATSGSTGVPTTARTGRPNSTTTHTPSISSSSSSSSGYYSSGYSSSSAQSSAAVGAGDNTFSNAAAMASSSAAATTHAEHTEHDEHAEHDSGEHTGASDDDNLASVRARATKPTKKVGSPHGAAQPVEPSDLLPTGMKWTMLRPGAYYFAAALLDRNAAVENVTITIRGNRCLQGYVGPTCDAVYTSVFFFGEPAVSINVPASTDDTYLTFDVQERTALMLFDVDVQPLPSASPLSMFLRYGNVPYPAHNQYELSDEGIQSSHSLSLSVPTVAPWYILLRNRGTEPISINLTMTTRICPASDEYGNFCSRVYTNMTHNATVDVQLIPYPNYNYYVIRNPPKGSVTISVANLRPGAIAPTLFARFDNFPHLDSWDGKVSGNQLNSITTLSTYGGSWFFGVTTDAAPAANVAASSSSGAGASSAVQADDALRMGSQSQLYYRLWANNVCIHNCLTAIAPLSNITLLSATNRSNDHCLVIGEHRGFCQCPHGAAMQIQCTGAREYSVAPEVILVVIALTVAVVLCILSLFYRLVIMRRPRRGYVGLAAEDGRSTVN